MPTRVPPCAPALTARLTAPRWAERWRRERPTPAEAALSLWECAALAGRQARFANVPAVPLTDSTGTQWSPFAAHVLRASLAPPIRDTYRAELIATWRAWAAAGAAHGDWGRLVAEGDALVVRVP